MLLKARFVIPAGSAASLHEVSSEITHKLLTVQTATENNRKTLSMTSHNQKGTARKLTDRIHLKYQ